ncbi:MAG: AAA family ATPase [Erysipelotrichales bacterium]
MEKTSLRAYVSKIIFHNVESNYYILATISDDENLTITGNLFSINEQSEYDFEGAFNDHPKYGLQFNAFSSSIVLPTESDLVVSFLSGPSFPGIGEATAKKIYETYQDKDEILEYILKDPSLLYNIKGITDNKVKIIVDGIKSYLNDNGLFKYLSSYQVDYQDVIKVYNKVSLDVDEFINIIDSNPFLLMEKSANFKEIDKFAQSLEIDNYDFLRFKGYIFQLIKNISFKTGSTYVEERDIINEYSRGILSDQEQDNLNQALKELYDDNQIVIEDEKIYEYAQYDAENFCAEFVNEFASIKNDFDISIYIDEYEDYHGIKFNNEQKEAIYNGVNCPISIVTGGPGTGKSTIVDALIFIIRKIDSRQLIGLAAPTGKASKRLSDLTNEKSMTIHKMLKFDMHSNSFGHNIFNPLDYNILIVDEASMIDNILMASLLKACFNIEKIIILGDYNQLPSVSQGQVLKDLIESDKMYVTYLKEIYRQKEGSKIIDLAYKVLNKEYIDESFFDDEYLNFISMNDNKESYEALKEYVAFEEKSEIQILTPLYKGKFGIDNINKNIQNIMHGNTEEKFNLSDRVIQLKNRNDDEIYNGDIGVIRSISDNRYVVEYESKDIIYSKGELIELNLAYCISIHKAQGNEYKEIILFLPNYCIKFIDRKILYTAITRTKHKLTIISDITTINQAIANDDNSIRKSNLQAKLKKA